MNIVVDDLSGPQIARFLDEHGEQMRSITPLPSKHALDLDGLRQPESHVLVRHGRWHPGRLRCD